MTPSEHVLQYFAHGHLPEPLQAIVKPIASLALQMESLLPDGPEKTAGLRKLLEAKDCLVRANLVAGDKPWWQTTDLSEVSHLLDNPDFVENKVLARKEVPPFVAPPMTDEEMLDKIFPPVPVTDARSSANTTSPFDKSQQDQAKIRSVVNGACYGPVISEPIPNRIGHLARCYWGICTWEFLHTPGDTGVNLGDLQRRHDEAGASLKDA